MPQWWEKKLKKYQRYKKAVYDLCKEAPPGLDLSVYFRLKQLQELRSDLKKAGDKHRLIKNIDGIIKAYESGELEWADGWVTYWSKGKMVCDGPREFTWDDFDYYCERYKKRQGIWVEGVRLIIRLFI